MRLRSRILRFLPIIAIALAGAIAAGAVAGSASAAGTTVNVTVGGGTNGVTANGFFPSTVTITTGTTIHFSNPYAEPHTVSFLPGGPASAPPLIVPDPAGSPAQGINPVYSNQTPASPATFDATKPIESGVLQQGQTYDVSFPATGTFTFFCAFHPMQLTVKVVSSGSVDTQTALDTRAATESAATLAAGNAETTTLSAAPVTSTTNADGTKTWSVRIGGDADVTGTTDSSDIMKFFPSNVDIKQGDTITWTNGQDVPHTVSFGFNPPLPPLFTPIPENGGAFLAISPQIGIPAGGGSYAGTGQSNSGVLGAPGPTTYSLKFTSAGTFQYVCLLHADQGMKGTITVAASATGAPTPAPAAPTPPTGVVAPNTGTGPSRAAAPGGWLASIIVAGIAGGALVLVGTRRLWSARG